VSPAGPQQGRRWHNRPIVRERDARVELWIWSMLLGLAVAVVPAGVYMVHQNECLRTAYEVNELQRESERLIEEARRLRMERARLSALPRIESWALRKGGLVRPEPAAVRVVARPARSPVDLMARADADTAKGETR
jgi:cell division protein FtsL